MGKRSDFQKRELDKYYTPVHALRPALSWLKGAVYAEPCLGAGNILTGLNTLTFRMRDRPVCGWASDISPDHDSLRRDLPDLYYYVRDALTLTHDDLKGCDLIFTNPPFEWGLLSELIGHFIELKPTILLLPSDMADNKRFSQFMRWCSDIEPIGRVSWMGNGVASTENFSWYFFDARWCEGYSRKWPRA